ncbi:single-stranded DNA-binding protein [Helicobacter saguini]|uniref:Single-stranded DNA-binding protein n=1 Tax=Helicobacter saguini TaxID=1548018 RepID=A0A347VQ90_9HELI|nr:single-stranded DNA-binding protein [Helicobacter saguini]
MDLSVFGRAAQIMSERGLKGSRILIEGRLLFSQWIDKVSGMTRSKHSVIVESLQLLDFNKANVREQNIEQPPSNTQNMTMQQLQAQMQQLNQAMQQMQQNQEPIPF